MRKTIAVIAALAATLWGTSAAAGTYVLRSSGTGTISAPAAAPSAPTIPIPPELPAGFTLSMTGETSVTAGATLDLRPVVSGASGSVSYSYSGRLPLGATFDAATGRIAGRALIAGSYTVWVSATDSSGEVVTAVGTIVVT